MCQGSAAGAPEAPGDAAPGGGWRRRRRWLVTGRRRGSRADGAVPLPDPSHRWSVPDRPRRDTRAARWAGLERPRGRGMRRLTGRHAAGATRCARDGYSRSSCHDCFGGLDTHGGNYLHWLVTARVNSRSGNFGPRDGFRIFRTKGDDEERHRRRRQVNPCRISRETDPRSILEIKPLESIVGAISIA